MWVEFENRKGLKGGRERRRSLRADCEVETREADGGLSGELY